MHTLILTAEDYNALQQVFADHFQRSETYMERLTDALLIHSTALAEIAPQERRRFIQANAPEYLFQKRGMAWDKAFLDEIHHALDVQRTMPIKVNDFYHIANLVVASLSTLTPTINSLYSKICELITHPIDSQDKVVLVLRVGFTELV
jgi:hypothetical protein